MATHGTIHSLFPVPAAPAASTSTLIREAFSRDAALDGQGAGYFVSRRLPFAVAAERWEAQIASEQLSDRPVASLHNVCVDHRDGALVYNVAGSRGCAYTPHAWSQLTGLMRTQGAPAGVANAFRWLAPLARHHAWADVVRRSMRPRSEEGIFRMFMADGLPSVRAVVSGRHSLHHFDDKAVLNVLRYLAPAPLDMSVYRGWDKTHATCALGNADNPDVRLAFSLRNSETGCASLAFSGSLVIRALDVVVEQPSGAKFERLVQIASERGATRRRHTLPRFSTSSGSRLSPAVRQRIADQRIAADVDTALTASRVLAERWSDACRDVNPNMVAFAKLTVADGDALMVLRDQLLATGLEIATDEALLKAICEVVASDARLRSIPHGSAAHTAATLAVLASTGERSWDDARALQRMAGAFIVQGWKR